MVGLVIATHSNVSEELMKAAEMFSGPLNQCRAWTLNPGDDIEQGEKLMEQYVDELDTGDGVLVMADLFGGSESSNDDSVYYREGRQNFRPVN